MADVAALLEAGADPNARAVDGKIPWDMIPEDSQLRGTDAYWRLNEPRADEEQSALSSDSASEEHAEFSENTKRLLALYQELCLFKDDPEFHQVGFGVCCRFNDWQKRLEELSSRTKLETFYDIGMVPGDLSVLGLEYLTSKGQPTNYSLEFEPQWEAGIARLELQR